MMACIFAPFRAILRPAAVSNVRRVAAWAVVAWAVAVPSAVVVA